MLLPDISDCVGENLFNGCLSIKQNSRLDLPHSKDQKGDLALFFYTGCRADPFSQFSLQVPFVSPLWVDASILLQWLNYMSDAKSTLCMAADNGPNPLTVASKKSNSNHPGKTLTEVPVRCYKIRNNYQDQIGFEFLKSHSCSSDHWCSCFAGA